ncbi:11115_t:CDS:2, partial [Entrophospora sp. SA101]
SWALKFEYMSKLGISYIYQKSSWFCIADSSKFTEEETINFLTAHSYDPDFQITHPEHKKLKLLKLFDFIPQELKSLDNYLQAIYPFINSPVLKSLDNTSILDEEDEEEDENTVDNEDNINLEGSEELILKGDLNLDQYLKNALYAFQQN